MTIRKYQSGDEQQIQELFKKVFKKDRSAELWTWKFLNNPQKMNPWILLYEEKGNILGHLGLWISEGYVNGEVKPIALRVDTMVDPEARGKGIYKKLNEAMVELAKEEGISYLYGFPAPKAKELLLRYTNGVHVADVSRYMKILRPGNIATARFPFLKPLKGLGNLYSKGQRKTKNLPNDVKVINTKKCDERFDQLAKKANSIKPFLLKRTSAYLNWRFLNHPTEKYTILALEERSELLGYVVVKKSTTKMMGGDVKTGFIIDWLAADGGISWENLLKAALQELRDMDLIQTWAFPPAVATELLTAYGFLEKDKPMPFIVHDLEAANGEWKEASNWWVTPGDVDSF
ncbi:GNAT family N-acetyltransferase [Bacillaceae bacterium S4-13-56]